MLPLFLLTVVCVLTYTFEIVFGLAGTILMLLVMTLVYDSKTLVIYSTMPQILVGIIALARSPRTVDFGFFARMLAFALLGGVVGLYLFYSFSTEVFDRLLAGVISLSGLYLLLAPERLKLSNPVARSLDGLAGASQALFGISGPIAMTRLLATVPGKTAVRNYAIAFSLSLNLFRAGGYVANQTVTPEILQMMLVTAPFIVGALWFGNQLHFRVNERLFRRVVSAMILFGGLTLFFR